MTRRFKKRGPLPVKDRHPTKEGNMKASLGIRSFLTGVVGLGLTCLLLPSSAMAISGQCANCHTMHNSQDGAQVSADAGDRLLKFGTCIGCHTGDNAGGAGVVPYVMAGADPGTDYLAGGNFFWVSEAGAAADTKGHNVASVKAGQDANMPSLAPRGGTAVLGQPSLNALAPLVATATRVTPPAITLQRCPAATMVMQAAR